MGKRRLLLTRGEAQDPNDSDIRYLSALASVKAGQPLSDALDNLNASLAAGRFYYYSTRDASTLKADLLVRERRWREALDALGAPSAASTVDPSYRLIRARAYAGMRDEAAFIGELSEAMNRFPDDPSFARLFIARAGNIPSSSKARELGATVLGRLSSYARVDPELPVLAAPLMPDISSQRDAVLAFRASGGSSPAATLRALEYGIIDEASAAKELLSSAKAVGLRDLGSLLALAGSPSGKAAVTAAISGWTGQVQDDSGGDGIPDSEFTLDKGLVEYWAMDSAHWGKMDISAAFADGLPVSAHLDRPGVAIQVAYSAYPEVASIQFTEGGEKRSYYFAPGAYSYDPLAMKVFAGEGRTAILFPYADLVPAPSERSCIATALKVSVESGSSRRDTMLDKGIPQAATSYIDGRLYSTTSYSQGRPVLEKVDADGDGRFETERSYSSLPDGTSIPTWQRSDLDGDGVFEYREQLVFPFRQEWDYDGNGSADAVRFQLSDGSIEEQFSSRLDGQLDETLVVKAGKVVALSRNGVTLNMVPDANARLLWIGKKNFDLGSNLPAGEGLFAYMGVRYRLTRIGDMAFAELVP